MGGTRAPLLTGEARKHPQLQLELIWEGAGGCLPFPGLPHPLPIPALMRTSWSRAATQEEEEENEEEEKREKEEAPSQQAAERGLRCVGQIPASRLPPAGCGRGEDPAGYARLLPTFGVALEQPGVLR